MKKVIFVSGLPRAMTTLMCNVLANNPQIGGGETSPLLEYLYGARASHSSTPEVRSALTQELIDEAFINFCSKGLEGYSEMITPKPIYVDKSRGWVNYAPFLWSFYPSAKIIVMVRDLRSVVASFEKKWRENPQILDARDNPQIQDFVTVEQRVRHFLDDAPLGIALKRLYNALETGTLKNMLVVKAEDFCATPEKVMRRVYSFIEEPYFDMDYNNVTQVTVENDRVADFGIYGDHEIRPEIKPLPKDAMDILGKDLFGQIKTAYPWFYNEFKYF